MSQAELVAALVDALAAGGAAHAVISPGYRSAPLAVALAAHPGIESAVIVDERVAGFFALGLARARERPVILACTSGSAVANYLPAVVEAAASRLPLVILTADRPPELQQVGAPQTIPQRGIFGAFVVHEDELAAPAAIDLDVPRDPWGARIALALALATDPAGGGPVHLNVPLRKPLVEVAGLSSGTGSGAASDGRLVEAGEELSSGTGSGAASDGPLVEAGEKLSSGTGSGAASNGPLVDGRADRSSGTGPGAASGGRAGRSAAASSGAGAWARPRILAGARHLGAPDLDAVERALAGATRPVIVAGPGLRGRGDDEARAIVDLAARSGWPVVADVLSPARPWALQHGEALLHGEPEAIDAVLWVGPPPTSAALLRWIGGARGPVVQVVAEPRWRDPSFRADLVVWADPAATLAALSLPPAPTSWLAGWRAREAAAAARIAGAGALGRWEVPLLHRALETWPGDHVHVASSSAIRDVDLVARLRPGARVLCSRGVNGIDGTLATAAGEARGLAAPLLAIVGDLALAHDLGALVHAPAPHLSVLVIDNGGGQIFRQLPPLAGLADFERLFATPVPVDAAALARLGGLELFEAEDDDALAAALGAAYERGRALIWARVDPRAAAAARARFRSS
ncbi:MAG: thiamine pyrophosphate-binding protein [Nannocystaceae bacterium]